MAARRPRHPMVPSSIPAAGHCTVGCQSDIATVGEESCATAERSTVGTAVKRHVGEIRSGRAGAEQQLIRPIGCPERSRPQPDRERFPSGGGERRERRDSRSATHVDHGIGQQGKRPCGVPEIWRSQPATVCSQWLNRINRRRAGAAPQNRSLKSPILRHRCAACRPLSCRRLARRRASFRRGGGAGALRGR